MDFLNQLLIRKSNIILLLKGGKRAAEGEVRTWANGKRYKKINKKWIQVNEHGQPKEKKIKPESKPKKDVPIKENKSKKKELSPELKVTAEKIKKKLKEEIPKKEIQKETPSSQEITDNQQDYKVNGVKAKAFKSWFGDWEQAKQTGNYDGVSKVVDSKTGEPKETFDIQSKVVDKENKPLQVFHGTGRGGFEEFSKEKMASSNLYGDGFYFTEDKEIADQYKKKSEVSEYEPDRFLGFKDKKGKPVKVAKIDNPKELLTKKLSDSFNKEKVAELTEKIKVLSRKRKLDVYDSRALDRMKTDLEIAHNSDKIIATIVNSTISKKRLPTPPELNWLMRDVGYMKNSTIEQIKSYYKNYAYEILEKVNFKNNTLPLPEKESSYQLKKIHELISDKYEVNSKPSPEQTFSVFLNIKNPKDFDSIPDDNEIQELISYAENVDRKDGEGKIELYWKHIFDDFLLPDGKGGYKKDKVPKELYDATQLTPKLVRKMWQEVLKHPSFETKEGRRFGFNLPVKGEMTFENLYTILMDGGASSVNKHGITEYLKSKGHDGITHVGGHNIGSKDHKVWIAFEPNQIKAVDNSGDFNPQDNNMYKAFLLRKSRIMEILLKGKRGVIGEVRTWRGGRYKKGVKGWQKVSERTQNPVKSKDKAYRESEVSRLSKEIQEHKDSHKTHTEKGTKEDLRAALYHDVRARVKERRLSQHKAILEKKHGVKEKPVKKEVSELEKEFQNKYEKDNAKYNDIIKQIIQKSPAEHEKRFLADAYDFVPDMNHIDRDYLLRLAEKYGVNMESKDPGKKQPSVKSPEAKEESNVVKETSDSWLNDAYKQDLIFGKIPETMSLQDKSKLWNLSNKVANLDSQLHKLRKQPHPKNLKTSEKVKEWKKGINQRIKAIEQKRRPLLAEGRALKNPTSQEQPKEKAPIELKKEFRDKFYEWRKKKYLRGGSTAPKTKEEQKNIKRGSLARKFMADTKKQEYKEYKQMLKDKDKLKDYDPMAELTKPRPPKNAGIGEYFADMADRVKAKQEAKKLDEIKQVVAQKPEIVQAAKPTTEIIQSGNRGATIGGQHYTKREVDILNSLDAILAKVKSPEMQAKLKKEIVKPTPSQSKEPHIDRFLELTKKNKSQADKQAGYPEERRKVEAETGVKIPREKVKELIKP